MQNRNNPEEYERYLRGMDASMRQKVALAAAHLLGEGTVADMGCGSGAWSEALAGLYPRVHVVGVDADAVLVERAREAHERENLRFELGDVATRVFEDGSLDAVFDSSVLHHVTSYNGYGFDRAREALRVQADALRTHGMLIVRDFVDPGHETVFLDVPSDDGDDGSDPRSCSTSRLFERFASEFRSLSDQRGFPYEAAPPDGRPAPASGRRRYRLSLKHAAEFLLRKDYRQDWESEAREEYTYFTQEEFRACLEKLGLRIVASTPLRNPWIVRNRWEGKCELWSTSGDAVDYPPTNFIIAAERVPDGCGVRFSECETVAPLGFLELEHYRDRQTGATRDLVRRPSLTIDVLPYFRDGGIVQCLARRSYPRPLVQSRRADASPDGSTSSGYITESLTVMQRQEPVRESIEQLLAKCGITAAQIRGITDGRRYFPSPGGTKEEVRSVYVEIEPAYVLAPTDDISGWSTSGHVRAIEAQQLLRSTQVGGVPDARLEINVYEVLRRLDVSAGSWIGDELSLPAAATRPSHIASIDELRGRAHRQRFEPADPGERARFLEVCCSKFEELDARGRVVRARPFEYVLPATLSTNTVATALLWKHGTDVLIGLDDDDLPAAQAFNGTSDLYVAPAWRLPRAATSWNATTRWIAERAMKEYGVEVTDTFALGGRYYPSPGTSPEAVLPLALAITSEHPGERTLTWVSLRDLVASPDLLEDGHLAVVAARAAHALSISHRAGTHGAHPQR